MRARLHLFAVPAANMSDRAYDKIRVKMAAKYGGGGEGSGPAGSSSGGGDWRSKTKFSWNL